MKSRHPSRWPWLLAAALLAIIGYAALRPLAMRASPQPSEFENARLRFEGYIVAKTATLWTIAGNGGGQVQIQVDSSSLLLPNPPGTAELYDWVMVAATHRDGQVPNADSITVERPASQLGPRVQFSGELKKGSPEWSVAGAAFYPPEGMLPGQEPPAKALVSVTAENRGGLLHALYVDVIAQDPQAVPVEFEGTINRVEAASGYWVIDDSTVYYDNSTQFVDSEPAQVGMHIEVQAGLRADNTLLAKLVRIKPALGARTLGGLVTAIERHVDGSEDWQVLVFPDGARADPVASVVRVERPSLVDESRASAGRDRWAELRVVPSAGGGYRAQQVQVSRPVPVTISGLMSAAPSSASSGRWLEVGGRPVWLAQPVALRVGLQVGGTSQFSGAVTIEGLVLGNGVIWAEQIRTEP